jgi:hypothetical protein
MPRMGGIRIERGKILGGTILLTQTPSGLSFIPRDGFGQLDIQRVINAKRILENRGYTFSDELKKQLGLEDQL